MTTTFDRPERTSKNGREYFETLQTQYEAVNDEVMFVVRHISGISPEYLERKPVSFRKKLVKQLLDEMQENSDGGAMFRR